MTRSENVGFVGHLKNEITWDSRGRAKDDTLCPDNVYTKNINHSNLLITIDTKAWESIKLSDHWPIKVELEKITRII